MALSELRPALVGHELGSLGSLVEHAPAGWDVRDVSPPPPSRPLPLFVHIPSGADRATCSSLRSSSILGAPFRIPIRIHTRRALPIMRPVRGSTAVFGLLSLPSVLAWGSKSRVPAPSESPGGAMARGKLACCHVI